MDTTRLPLVPHGGSTFLQLAQKAAKIGKRELSEQLFEIFTNPEVKHVILRLIVEEARNSINLLQHALRHTKYYKIFAPGLNIYSWNLKHFIERMKPTSSVTMLHLETPGSLVILKLLTDLRNINHVLKLTYTDIDKAADFLCSCHRMMAQQNSIIMDYNNMTEEAIELNDTLTNFDNTEGDKLNMVDQEYDNINQELDEGQLVDPIEARCVVKTTLAHHEMLEHSYQEQVQELEDEIDQCRDDMKFLLTTSQMKNDYCYESISDYQKQLDAWGAKYEFDYERADAERSVLKKRLVIVEEEIIAKRKRIVDLKNETERVLIKEMEKALALAEEMEIAEYMSARKSSKPSRKSKKNIKKK